MTSAVLGRVLSRSRGGARGVGTSQPRGQRPRPPSPAFLRCPLCAHKAGCSQHLALVPRLGRRAGRRRDLSGLFLGEPRSPRLQFPPEEGWAGRRAGPLPRPGAPAGSCSFCCANNLGPRLRLPLGKRRPAADLGPWARGGGRVRDRERP